MGSNVEELHSRASGHYLRGDFAAATATWRRVLEIQPADARAREGIRLCESLLGTLPEPGPEDPARRDALGLGDDTLPAARAAAPPSPVADVPPRPAAADTLSAEDAENQLQFRTAALLEEARQLVAKGESEAALRALDRVLILDEENAEALALQAALQLEEAETRAQPPPPPEVAEVPPLTIPAPPVQAPAPPSEPQVEAPVRRRDPVWPKIREQLGSVARSGRRLGTLAGLWRRLAPRAPQLPSWLGDRRVQLGLAAGVLIALAWIGVSFMLGGQEEPLVAAPRPRPSKAAQAPAPAADPTASAPAAVAMRLVREAEAAFQSGDFAAAVVAYDKVLDLEPDRADVRERLNVAAERYKEQQASDEQWAKIVHEFGMQNFADALHLLYRVPAGRPGVDIERCKVNGWYNLGVNALQASDCERALGHFEEALTLAAADPGVLEGLDLAETCKGDEVQERIRRLALRQLTD